MPQLVTYSRDNPDFARVVEVARIEGAEFAFDIRPTDDEARALARLLGARSVRKLHFSGRITPAAGSGWTLEATLGATVVQTCVVSLEPVTTRIDERVHRRFLPAIAERPEIQVSPENLDEVEPLAERIDLGLVATEALSLALPDYPRKPGAALGEAAFAADGIRPLQDADIKPFARLAALRDKLGGGS